MTQKPSSKPDDKKVETPPPEEDLVVEIEGAAPEPDKKPEEVKPEPPKQEDAGVEALKKELEAAKTAREAAEKRIRDEAFKTEQARNEAARYKTTAEESQYDSIVNAMESAKVEADAATQAFKAAFAAGDADAATDAQKKIARAEANLVRLEENKRAYEERKANPPSTNGAANPSDQLTQIIDANPNLVPEEKVWLRRHPEALTDHRKNSKMNAAYYDAIDKGLTRGSPEYFDFIETALGYKQSVPPPPANGNDSQREVPSQGAFVSAPPSREGQSISTGQPTKTVHRLTAAEAEIARLSGLTPAQYVQNKLKLEELKKQGHYQGQG